MLVYREPGGAAGAKERRRLPRWTSPSGHVRQDSSAELCILAAVKLSAALSISSDMNIKCFKRVPLSRDLSPSTAEASEVAPESGKKKKAFCRDKWLKTFYD